MYNTGPKNVYTVNQLFRSFILLVCFRYASNICQLVAPVGYWITPPTLLSVNWYLRRKVLTSFPYHRFVRSYWSKSQLFESSWVSAHYILLYSLIDPSSSCTETVTRLNSIERLGITVDKNSKRPSHVTDFLTKLRIFFSTKRLHFEVAYNETLDFVY